MCSLFSFKIFTNMIAFVPSIIIGTIVNRISCIACSFRLVTQHLNDHGFPENTTYSAFSPAKTPTHFDNAVTTLVPSIENCVASLFHKKTMLAGLTHAECALYFEFGLKESTRTKRFLPL
jgi:hypothetical protein